MSEKIKVKLQSMDPTGIPFKADVLELPLEGDDSRRMDRLFLSVGECLYRIDKKGYIIERVIPHELT